MIKERWWVDSYTLEPVMIVDRRVGKDNAHDQEHGVEFCTEYEAWEWLLRRTETRLKEIKRRQAQVFEQFQAFKRAESGQLGNQ